MKRGACLPLTVFLLVPAHVLGQAQTGAVSGTTTDSQTGVLTLYTARDNGILPETAPYYKVREQTYRRVLGGALGDQLAYYSELFDPSRLPHASQSDDEDYLVRKYADRMIKLLIANGPEEAALAGRLQARLPSEPPIVFVNHDARPVPKSTGHSYRWAHKESIDLALRVHPDTRHVFVVCDPSPLNEERFRSEVPEPQGVEFTFLRGYSVSALTRRLAALPEHSIVFLHSFSSEPDGRRFRMVAVSEHLAAASNAPIYTWNGNAPGVFGGRLLSSELIAERTSELALRVLRGERPEDIPITAIDVSVDALDWRQLDRWDVSEADVPPGVELRFREPGLFQRYRNYVLSAVAVLLLQTLLIAGLLIQRRNRQRAERSLRESEERFRLMADTAPVMVWRAGPDQRCDFFNQPWLEFRGRRLRDEVGDGWTRGVHPDDLQRCLTVYTAAWPGRESFRMEYRLQRADGEFRWVLDTGVPRLDAGGALLGYIGSCIDITERRQAEDALRGNEAALRQSHAQIQDLAGRLITAQEAERARIARELHDDISQQLAAISIAMSECKRPELQGSAELLEALADTQRQTMAVAADIRLLSHDLHPGVLKHAGLVEAVRGHCHEFAKQQAIDVVVEADDDLTIADRTTALCLFRVLQEALQNTAKHADARRVRVTIRGVAEEMQLAVADDGKGFTLAAARERGDSLGLRSIEERVRLVGGRLSIETAPDRGTTITVWVKSPVAAVREFAGI